MGCSARLPPSLVHSTQNIHLSRRTLLSTSTTAAFSLAFPLASSSASSLQPDTTITDRIFMDFSFCPSYFSNRTLGDDDLALCPDSEPLGRLVLGLYGNIVPVTVSNFKSMCTGTPSGSSYKGTLVQKIFPGQFFVAGRQGQRNKGEVKPPTAAEVARNTEESEKKGEGEKPKAAEAEAVMAPTAAAAEEEKKGGGGGEEAKEKKEGEEVKAAPATAEGEEEAGKVVEEREEAGNKVKGFVWLRGLRVQKQCCHMSSPGALSFFRQRKRENVTEEPKLTIFGI